MGKVQLAIGKKGAYTDHFVHGNLAIAEAYFRGMSLHPNQKARILDEQGNIVAVKKNLEK